MGIGEGKDRRKEGRMEEERKGRKEGREVRKAGRQEGRKDRREGGMIYNFYLKLLLDCQQQETKNAM